jgi:hypothetical protein
VIKTSILLRGLKGLRCKYYSPSLDGRGRVKGWHQP